jgi:hypothetical protein
MNHYRPSFLSTVVIGLILTVLEIACAAGIGYSLRGHLRPMAINIVSILMTIGFVSYWTQTTVRRWSSGADPIYGDPGVQLGARMSSRLSLAFFLVVEVYLIVFRGTVNPFAK